MDLSFLTNRYNLQHQQHQPDTYQQPQLYQNQYPYHQYPPQQTLPCTTNSLIYENDSMAYNAGLHTPPAVLEYPAEQITQIGAVQTQTWHINTPAVNNLSVPQHSNYPYPGEFHPGSCSSSSFGDHHHQHQHHPGWMPEVYRPQYWENCLPPGVSTHASLQNSDSRATEFMSGGGMEHRTLGAIVGTSSIGHNEKKSTKNSENKVGAIKPMIAKESSVAKGGPGWCSVCQRNCVTEVALRQHLEGKGHKKQLQKQLSRVELIQQVSDENETGVANILEQMWLQVSMMGKGTKPQEQKIKVEDAPAVGASKVLKNNESFRCELCNVECNSNTVLEIHFGGKKHKARVKKMSEQGDGDCAKRLSEQGDGHFAKRLSVQGDEACADEQLPVIVQAST